MEEDFDWSDNSAVKTIKIGGKFESTNSTISFIGNLAGASLSCKLAGSDHWNEPYFALASVSASSVKGIWFLDINTNSLSNSYNVYSFSPHLKDGGTAPVWNDTEGTFLFSSGQSKVINLQNYLEYNDSAAMKGFTVIALAKRINSPLSGEEGSIIKMEGRRTIGFYINNSNMIILKFLKSDGVTWKSQNTGVVLSTNYIPILFGFQRNEIDPQNSVITYQIGNSEEMGGFIVDGKSNFIRFWLL